MNIYQPDITTPSTATTDASAKRVTVTSEAERRAHVAKWIARMQNTGAATLGTAMLFLPAVAGAQMAGDGLVNAAGIDGVRDVELLDDGSARITLENGRVLNVTAEDVVVGASGEVQVSGQVADIVDEAAAAAAPAAGGGAAGAIAAGAAAGVAGIAAASGGGGDGGGGGSDPAPVVLNAADVASSKSLSDIFGRNPDPEADRVTVTIGSGDEAIDVEAQQDDDGNWTLPPHFSTQQGEQPISFSADKDAVDDDGAPLFDDDGNRVTEEADSGSAAVDIDTIAPQIAIDTPIASDDVLNIVEQDAGFDITGTTDAEDGQEVTVTLSGAAGTPLTATGNVQGGAWTVSFTPAQAADLDGWDTVDIAAAVADAAGNESLTTADFATDFTAPTITIDDISGDNQIDLADVQNGLAIAGTTDAEDGRPVTVTFNGETYTGAVAGGTWSVSVPAEDLDTLDTGDTPEVSATVQDAAGNPPASPATRPLTVDLTGPSLTMDAIAGDNVINADESMSDVTISGTTSNVGAGQDVTITVDGADPLVVQTQGDGTWSATLPAADAVGLGDDASVTVEASVEDANGIEASDTATLTMDFTAPEILIDPNIAGDDVLNITERDAGFDITGTTDAEVGQEVTVTLTGQAATTEIVAIGTVVAGDDPTDPNAWTASFTPAQAADLDGWDNVDVAATVKDIAGNEGGANTSFTTDFDPPVVTIDALPLGDDTILNAAESGKDLVITGTATETDQVTVTLNGADPVTGPVTGGVWSITIPSATLQGLDPEATIQVSATAEDDAGNTGEDDTSFATDFNPPSLTVDPLEIGAFLNIMEANGEVSVTGSVADNDSEDVTVSVAGQEVTASVDAQGDWTATFAAGALEALSDGDTEFTITTQDAAGNPSTATSAPFTVDLTAPDITVDDPPPQPFTLDVAEREDADGFGFTTSESGNETVTLTFTSAGGSVDLSLTETLGNIPETGGVFDFPLTPAELAMLEDLTEYTVEIGITDAAGNPDTDDFDLSTDFEPEITLDEIGTEGVLILDDIDPANVSISGTTSGVEAGEVVTVDILDDQGSSIFTDTSATVQSDGTWTLDLPEATVNDLKAGQSFDVQADVSNAAGRDAPQAQEQVVAYLPAANFAVETIRAGGDIGLEIQTDMSVATGSVLNSVDFTTSFDPNLASLDLSAFNIPNALTTTTIQPNAFNLTELGGLNTNDGSFSFGGNSLAGFDNLDTEALFGFGVSGINQNEILEIRISDDAGANSTTSADQLTVAGQPTPQSFEDSFGPSTSYLGTVGSDTIVANDADTLVRGRGGDDAIDLSGAGVNTVQFEADPTANGFDTVTDFSIGGPLPDRLGFAGLNNEDLRGDGGAFELLSGTDSVGADTGLIVFTTAMADLTAGSVLAAVDDLDGPADGDVLYLLASDGTDAQLYEVRVQAGSDTVTDMARFQGLDDLTGMSEANILGFDTTATPV